jgi:hypothetical protein
MTYFIWQGEDAIVVAFPACHHDAPHTQKNASMEQGDDR